MYQRNESIAEQHYETLCARLQRLLTDRNVRNSLQDFQRDKDADGRFLPI